MWAKKGKFYKEEYNTFDTKYFDICVALRLLQPPVFETGRKDYRSCRNASLPLLLAGII